MVAWPPASSGPDLDLVAWAPRWHFSQPVSPVNSIVRKLLLCSVTAEMLAVRNIILEVVSASTLEIRFIVTPLLLTAGMTRLETRSNSVALDGLILLLKHVGVSVAHRRTGHCSGPCVAGRGRWPEARKQ